MSRGDETHVTEAVPPLVLEADAGPGADMLLEADSGGIVAAHDHVVLVYFLTVSAPKEGGGSGAWGFEACLSPSFE